MTSSLWIATTDRTNFKALQCSVSVDVAIVGGGISGLTAARLLKEAGKTVAVLELHRILEGETGHTTAHITEAIDARYHTVQRDFGKDGAQLVARSSRAAMQQIEHWVRTMGISCSYRKLPGFLFTESGGTDLDDLQKEADAAREAGVSAEFTRDVPLPFAKGGIRFDDQAQFHPREYLLSIAETIPGDGSFLFEDTSVINVEDGEPCRVETADGTVVSARAVFVAANVPVNNGLFLNTKLPAYRTYAIGVRTEPVADLQGLFWDTADPYHYIRTHTTSDGEILIVGGEDHRTGDEPDTEKRFRNLEEYTQRHFRLQSTQYRWSGQVIEPLDGLPYIGRNSFSRHVYVATGYSGQGMTFGTLGGMMVSDLILTGESRYERLFDPTRIKPIASAKAFIAENLDFPKHLIPDRLTSLDVEATSLEEVEPGSGCLVKFNGKKLAVSRSEKGEVIALSPICTHMGCDVKWNTAEKSWDCPCHGSRFTPTGEVLNGPAVAPLSRVDLTEK